MKIKILIPVYNDWQSVFKLLENINSEMNNLERFFTDPKEIENPEQLAKLGLKHEGLKKQSEELEREWEQLSSDVETNIT